MGSSTSFIRALAAGLLRPPVTPCPLRLPVHATRAQVDFWAEFAFSKALEGPILDGVGLGYPGFFALSSLDSDAAWSRFARNGRVNLRCEILECE